MVNMIKEADNTDKNRAIGAVIAKYLPAAEEKALRVLLKSNLCATGVNIEQFAEIAMAIVGKMQKVNGRGYDFIRVIDGVETRPESKTSSLLPKPRASGNYGGVIRNVTRENGHQKEGDILALIYIPYNDSVKFFYIPKAWWVKHVTSNGWICYTYNISTDSIPTFKEFECKTFEDLCSPDRIGKWELRNKKLNVLWGAMLDAAIAKDMQKAIRARDDYNKFLLAKAA
jgi:hypothetical protein